MPELAILPAMTPAQRDASTLIVGILRFSADLPMDRDALVTLHRQLAGMLTAVGEARRRLEKQALRAHREAEAVREGVGA